MSKATPADATSTPAAGQTGKPKVNGQARKANDQAQPGRVISDPKEVAQIVMMQIDNVNVKKDELTIAVKALADTAKKLFSAYANQQAQIARLAKRVEELEKAKG